MAGDLAANGGAFARVEMGIVHHYAPTLRRYAQKQRRRARRSLSGVPVQRRGFRPPTWRLAVQALLSASIVWPALLAARGVAVTVIEREPRPGGKLREERTAAGGVDAATFSASGVDPHVSPANAAIQAHRIAAVRHLPLARVQHLIDAHTDDRSLGFLGEPGVNVVELNLQLDQEAPVS